MHDKSGDKGMLMSGLAIEREILIEAPVDVVWRTITEPDQVSQWFADRVHLVVKPGVRGYLEFGDQGGWGDFLDRLTVLVAKHRSG